jgi:nucleoside-diphosphate-sugar epimerase
MSEARMAEMLRAEAVTHLLHAAWDMNASSQEELDRTCVAGTERLLSAAKAASVHQVIFISTISAFEDARSVYGKSKLAVEKQVIAAGGLVLRLGLVCGEGDGGMFGSLRAIVAKHRFIPIISGAGAQYLLHERTLAISIVRAMRGELSKGPRVLTLAHPDPIRMPDLLRTLAAREGHKVILIPVPWPLVYLALRLGEAAGLRMGFRSDSVISLVHQNPCPDLTPLSDHAIDTLPFRTYEAS